MGPTTTGSWRGRHAVITGGSSGIGLALAHRLARRGAAVSLIARGEERLTAAAAALREHGATIGTAAADVADRQALVRALDDLQAKAGPCDALVTCAGLARPGHFLELDDEVFRTMMEVDYFGTLHAIRAVAPAMVTRGSGSIVAVSSGAALLGIFGYTAYAPAKFAVRGLMEVLRDELGPHGVHVACVYPPDVDTPQLADENRFKPDETFAISGTVEPISADEVADAMLRGIDRRRFAIYPNAEMRLLATLAPPLAPLVRRLVDRKVRGARG
jgi:3-dehydrosphinganine reductase